MLFCNHMLMEKHAEWREEQKDVIVLNTIRIGSCENSGPKGNGFALDNNKEKTRFASIIRHLRSVRAFLTVLPMAFRRKIRKRRTMAERLTGEVLNGLRFSNIHSGS